MKILCIDDDPAELEKAEVAVAAAGHRFVGSLINGSATLGVHLEKMTLVDAIISDLHFKPIGSSHHQWRNIRDDCPGGLLVIIEALTIGKPAVLCTSVDGQDDADFHHNARYGWLWDCECKSLYPILHNAGFGKNWAGAVAQVVALAKQKKQR
jgi:hypothetical protein